jgi:hypothetical protein
MLFFTAAAAVYFFVQLSQGNAGHKLEQHDKR